MAVNEQQGKLSPDTVYQQIHENIRTTDDISFKLMNLVPLISAGGISLLAKSDISWNVKCFVSVFAAIVVFGIFRWELRNIQSCNWQRARAERMDDPGLPDAPELRFIPRALVQLMRFLMNKLRKPGPTKKEGPVRIGKTQAEIIIYLTVILAWLLLPGVNGLWRPDRTPGGWIGAVTSLVLGVGLAAWIALSRPTSDSLKPQMLPAIDEETEAALTFLHHPYLNVYLHPIRTSEHFVGNHGAIAGLSDLIDRTASVSAEVTEMFRKAGVPQDKKVTVLQYSSGDPLDKALVLRASLAAMGKLETDIRAARPMDYVLASGPGGVVYPDRNSQNVMHLEAWVPDEVAEEVLTEHARRLEIRRTDDSHPEYHLAIARTQTGIAVALCGGNELNHSNASGWSGEAACSIFGIKVYDWPCWTLLTPIHAWYQQPPA
jgi:hypothetical protein